MTKKQFKNIANEIGYDCRYSGKTRTFFIMKQQFADVSGGVEFEQEILEELRHSSFNVIEQY